MAGFDRAAALGADLIELDVRLTNDGALAIIHDSTIDRTTNGSGRVADLTWNEMRALDAGIRFGEAFAGQRVPSLREVLDWARGRVYLAVEVKVPAPVPPDVLARIAEVIRDAGMADQVTMHDIPQPDISAVRRVDPAIQIMCDWGSTIRGDLPETVRRSSEIGAAAVIWDWQDVKDELVAQAHAAGLSVYAAGCPTTTEAVREARIRGIDILEADNVEDMAAAIAATMSMY